MVRFQSIFQSSFLNDLSHLNVLFFGSSPLIFWRSLDFFFHCHFEWQFFQSCLLLLNIGASPSFIAVPVLSHILKKHTGHSTDRSHLLSEFSCSVNKCDICSPPRVRTRGVWASELQWLQVCWIFGVPLQYLKRLYDPHNIKVIYHFYICPWENNQRSIFVMETLRRDT